MSYDIILAGQPFMLVPGSYRATQDGMLDSRLGRQRLTTFSAGQAQPQPVRSGSTEARGGLLSGLGAWPAPWPLGTQGIGPAPAPRVLSGTLDSAEPKLMASDSSYLFIVAGTTIYRWSRLLGDAPTARKTLPAPATGLVRLDDALYIAHGNAADVTRYDDATNTLTTSALGGGVRAARLGTFSRGIVLVHPNYPQTLQLHYGTSLGYVRAWQLDGRITNVAQHGERMIVATDAGLFILSGSWYQDSDPPAPPESLQLTSWGTLSGQLQDRDDFAWLTVYQGRLMAWLGKRVVVYDEARNWWRHAGLEGAATSGAAVVNGWLLATIAPRAGDGWQLWGYNGSGWWCLAQVDGEEANILSTPAPDGAGKLVTVTAGSGTLYAWDIDAASDPAAQVGSFTLTSPLLDGGEPDRNKYWRRIGIELARLDGASPGVWTFDLAHSSDGGATFVAAGSAVVSEPLASISFPIAATGSGLLLRVIATRDAGLPATVVALWAEYEVLNDSVRRKRWSFKVHARARGVDRDGALDSRTGQQIRSSLWDLWRSAATVPFHDIDAATHPTEHQVRIIGIREEIPKPADYPTLGADTLIEVTVVEV
jgi:hypothetical protein